MKYVSKQIVVEAMQFTDESKDQVFNWITCSRYADQDPDGNPTIVIGTLEGDMSITLGNWVIKGIKGEFYPCDREVFEAKYEKYNGVIPSGPMEEIDKLDKFILRECPGESGGNESAVDVAIRLIRSAKLLQKSIR